MTPPFRLYILLGKENLKTRSIFHETYYKPPPSSTRDREGPETLPGTLPRGESPPEAFFVTMPAFEVMRE
jgi:hypothetical protein